MPNKKTSVPFKGTPEQEAQLRKALEVIKNEKGALMPALQKAQEIYGYLPEEVQIIVAETLGVSLSEVYGVSTFYAQFTLNPKGETRISVCLGTACYVKNSGAILDKICARVGCQAGECSSDGKFSIDAVRCVGACGLAPVVIINDEVFGRLTPADVDKVLDKYIAK